MNIDRESVIRMAREADDYADKHTPGFSTLPNEWQEIRDKRFAALVAAEATEEANRRANASWTLMCKKMVAAEREANSKVRAGKPRQLPRRGMGILHGEQQHCFEMGWKEGAAAVRAAIRARGQA
jgi:hypothetical protein